jgi:hypothetical protein
MDVWSYLAGLATIPALILVKALIELSQYAIRRDYGYGPCDICLHLGGAHGYEIGDRTNARYWIDSRLHFWFWARRREHKIQRGAVYLAKSENGWHMPRPWDKRFMSRP